MEHARIRESLFENRISKNSSGNRYGVRRVRIFALGDYGELGNLYETVHVGRTGGISRIGSVSSEGYDADGGENRQNGDDDDEFGESESTQKGPA